MKGLHTLALCAMLAGCATDPTAFDKATPVSNRNVTDRSAMLAPGAQPAPGDAVLVVTRDQGMQLGACGMDFFVDDTQIATLNPGNGFRMRVSPGKHRARIEVGGFICPLYQSSVDVAPEAGRQASIRLGVDEMRPFIRAQ
jgi:hypothetical protein